MEHTGTPNTCTKNESKTLWKTGFWLQVQRLLYQWQTAHCSARMEEHSTRRVNIKCGLKFFKHVTIRFSTSKNTVIANIVLNTHLNTFYQNYFE